MLIISQWYKFVPTIGFPPRATQERLAVAGGTEKKSCGIVIAPPESGTASTLSRRAHRRHTNPMRVRFFPLCRLIPGRLDNGGVEHFTAGKSEHV